ncbi:MAG TPA: phasin family protein [Acidimicrobiales bacterium]|nr:phasin family protein [Acidimicrobiales bacterium]
MAKGDLFKRSLEAGTSFLDMTRERAEAMVKEWVEAGDLGRSRAQKAVEQVLDRSRKATDDLRNLVRKEIGEQLAALGVATREDVSRLEAKIEAVATPTAPGVGNPPPAPPPSTGVSTGAAATAARAAAKRKAAAPTATGAKKAAAKKTAAKKVPGNVTVKTVKTVKKVTAARKPPPARGPATGPPPGT